MLFPISSKMGVDFYEHISIYGKDINGETLVENDYRIGHYYWDGDDADMSLPDGNCKILYKDGEWLIKNTQKYSHYLINGVVEIVKYTSYYER